MFNLNPYNNNQYSELYYLQICITEPVVQRPYLEVK